MARFEEIISRVIESAAQVVESLWTLVFSWLQFAPTQIRFEAATAREMLAAEITHVDPPTILGLLILYMQKMCC